MRQAVFGLAFACRDQRARESCILRAGHTQDLGHT